jgi:UDP-perosamine 4-acetyltransferase
VRVVIYGSRPEGHAKVVLDLFQGLDGIEIIGLVDDYPVNRRRTIRGLAVVGDGSSLTALKADGVEGVVLGFGDNRERRRTCERIAGAGLTLPVLVHPTAVVSVSARLDLGAQVLPKACVGPDAALGDGVLINTGAIVEHDVKIGPGSVVGPGATLAGRVHLEQDVSVGAGATILPDRRVGEAAVVGAGAVVVRDVRSGEVVVGVPARPLT